MNIEQERKDFEEWHKLNRWWDDDIFWSESEGHYTTNDSGLIADVASLNTDFDLWQARAAKATKLPTGWEVYRCNESQIAIKPNDGIIGILVVSDQADTISGYFYKLLDALTK